MYTEHLSQRAHFYETVFVFIMHLILLFPFVYLLLMNYLINATYIYTKQLTLIVFGSPMAVISGRKTRPSVTCLVCGFTLFFGGRLKCTILVFSVHQVLLCRKVDISDSHKKEKSLVNNSIKPISIPH